MTRKIVYSNSHWVINLSYNNINNEFACRLVTKTLLTSVFLKQNYLSTYLFLISFHSMILSLSSLLITWAICFSFVPFIETTICSMMKLVLSFQNKFVRISNDINHY